MLGIEEFPVVYDTNSQLEELSGDKAEKVAQKTVIRCLKWLSRKLCMKLMTIRHNEAWTQGILNLH
jgi:hypothetical protein